jgi:hypothetical protein
MWLASGLYDIGRAKWTLSKGVIKLTIGTISLVATAVVSINNYLRRKPATKAGGNVASGKAADDAPHCGEGKPDVGPM